DIRRACFNPFVTIHLSDKQHRCLLAIHFIVDKFTNLNRATHLLYPIAHFSLGFAKNTHEKCGELWPGKCRSTKVLFCLADTFSDSSLKVPRQQLSSRHSPTYN